MKPYLKFLLLIIGGLIVYLAVVNTFQIVSLSEDEKIVPFDSDNSDGKIGDADYTPARRTSSARPNDRNFSQYTTQSNSLEDWQIFIRETLKEFEGDESMLKLYKYGDQRASEKKFDRVGYINEILRFKGDIYDVNSIMCNMYSRSIDISENQFLEEISSFHLSNIHKELFYSAAITSPVIQHADVEQLKLFLARSTDNILNKYISDYINSR